MDIARVFERPEIVVSRCIEFDPVRYNGSIVRSREVSEMKKFVNFIPVCPEVEIGLGIPRETVRIVRQKNEDRLIQTATGTDVTEDMIAFSDIFLNSLFSVDGFILKNRSPTSGIKDIKVYAGADKANSVAKRPGFFGAAVLSKYKNYPVEDEGRIKNQRIREHFLTRIFMLADLRKTISEGDITDLTDYHHKNKMLISAYSQKYQKILGNIAANREKRDFDEIVSDYKENLLYATKNPPLYTSNINAMMHALGQMPKDLTSDEKHFFLDNLDDYRKNRLPATAVRNILRSWAVRFDDENLLGQTFFSPYPKGLEFYEEAGMERGKDYSDSE
ncbi:MAG: DUF1722 domain-containing protein [Methanomicrobiaceae archaeon]|nr:DUF1722 domain-containing protein [Methanomicrobiaceae archaeon]